MAKQPEPKRHKLDAAHYFTCERASRGWYSYRVRRGDAQLSRLLFSTQCKALSIAEVEAHAREELRLYIERESAKSAAFYTHKAGEE